MEGLFGGPKNEKFRHGGWEGVTYEESEPTVAACIGGFGETRIKESLGRMGPKRVLNCAPKLGRVNKIP